MQDQKNSDRQSEFSRMNNQIMGYNMNSHNNPTRKNYIDAMQEIGLYQQTNQGGKHINVDKESELLNGR